MIERTNAFKVGDRTFGSLEEAQTHELMALVSVGDFGGAPVVPQFAALVIKNKDRVIDILTTTATSKPRARSIHGGKKNRVPRSTSELLARTATSPIQKPT